MNYLTTTTCIHKCTLYFYFNRHGKESDSEISLRLLTEYSLKLESNMNYGIS